MASKYDGATVEVINWEKYNPRGDSKRPSWFRLENNLAIGPAFFGLDCEQKWLWIVILSLVSQKNGEAITWNTGFIQATTGIKPKKQEETLDVFEQFVRLRVSRDVTLRDSPATNERTNEHNERTNITNEQRSSAFKFDFEILYEKYPRKLGKQKGIDKCKAQIKCEQDYLELSTAIDRYLNYLRAQGTEAKYIKHFDTFMTTWRDWLDPGAGAVPICDPKGTYVDPNVLELRRQLEEELRRGSA